MSTNLAYCGFGVSDMGAWQEFAAEGLGLECVPRGGTSYLRMDERSWRFALYPSGEDDILFAGFELNGAEALSALAQTLGAANIEYQALPEEQCAERGVDAGIWLLDPQGLRLEFVHGQRGTPSPFVSPLTKGFVTGEKGLGHIVFSVNDLDESMAFYRLLGMNLSDFIESEAGPLGKLRIAFLHCNARHHTMAIAALPGAKRMNHVMIELNDIDDVLIGHQRFKNLGYAPGNIGRHPNDKMLSFYVPTPSGFDIELGHGGALIGENWTPAEYDHFSIWGHERSA